MTYPGGLVVNYEYYPSGILKKVSDNNGNWQIRHIDALGRDTLIENSNGSYTEIIYDSRSRITYYANKTVGGTIVYSEAISYDAAGNITSRTPYNQLNPDFQAMLGMGQEMYSYGPSVDAQVTGPTSSWSRTFDDNGNVLSETDGAINNSFTWMENNLNHTANFNGQSITNGYNGLQMRDERTVNGVATRYVLDARRLQMPYILEERDGADNLLRSYVYIGGELAWMVDNAVNQSHFYHFDIAGNTQALTDASGVISQRYGMGSFGGFQTKETELDQPFIFSGKYGVPQDAPGLVLMRKRYYSTQSFRFISKDPFPWNSLSTQSVNRYSMALGNPLRWHDAKGLYPEDHLVAEGGSVGGIRINGLNGSSVLIETYLLNFTVNLTNGKRAVDWGGNHTLDGDDILSAALDIVGIFDPTGAADVANAILLAGKGDWIGAAISGIGVVPYFGDLAKLGRIGKQIKVVRLAIKSIKSSLNTFKYASKFGIGSYKSLRKQVLKKYGTGSGLEVHHLIEQRFAKKMDLDSKKMESIVLTKGEHDVFTKAWRQAIPYNNSNSLIKTSNATPQQIEAAARKIYKDYPEILKALGL